MLINRAQLGMNGRAMNALTAFVRGLGPALWLRYNTDVDASGWADQSGNGRDMTFFESPTVDAGGVLFDGVDQYGKCDAFTLEQPETVYFLGKQVTWTDQDRFFDGNTSSTLELRQITSSPQFRILAGSAGPFTGDLAVDVYGVIAAVFNGASSLLQVNNGTPATGDAGAGDAGGFTLGANGAPTGFGNIQAKEVIIFGAAHDAVTRARVIRYLSQVGQVGV